jgi:protein O-mannosyl-transferase
MAAGLIALLGGALYLPFLHNPFVFDDWVLFGGGGFAYFATHPFDFFQTRNLPNFSLAVTYILGGDIPIQRLVNLVLHLACALLLHKLLGQLLRAQQSTGNPEAESGSPATGWAAFGALVFAIHPVAVYGAGYLIQRSIVLATLFSLWSILLFLRGLRRGSYADALSAALLYSLAVYSKEHSILLPAVAALAALLVISDRRLVMRHASLYLAACAPAAIAVALLSTRVIGATYEADSGSVSNQLEGVFGIEPAAMTLSLSALTQTGVFFKYLFLWLWPDTGAMSVDLRVDFTRNAAGGWMLLKVGCFVLYGALGSFFLLRRGRTGLLGFGMLFSWILFLVELSASRFQEPFVLYRSYLWAPGILIALIALLSALPRRAVLPICLIVVPILFYQARDRLVSFSHPFLLWQDAVEKLPAEPVPWGSRSIHNLAREYAYAGKLDQAMALADRCMAQYPDTFHCYFAKGVILSDQRNFEIALPYLVRAVALNPKKEIAHYRLAQNLEELGRIEEAIVVLHNASALGFRYADNNLRRLAAAKTGNEPAPQKAPNTKNR